MAGEGAHRCARRVGASSFLRAFLLAEVGTDATALAAQLGAGSPDLVTLGATDLAFREPIVRRFLPDGTTLRSGHVVSHDNLLRLCGAYDIPCTFALIS